VIAKGQVAEQGTHEELISAKGKYAELWSKQIFVKPKNPTPDQQQEGQDSQTTNTAKEDKPSPLTSDAKQIQTLDGPSDDTTRNGDVPSTPVASHAKEV
jgi:hypothetical protein